MKKLLLSLFVIAYCIPLAVNAKEYCRVISGNTTKLGSEIACGTEHFYLLGNDGSTLNLLAKYNLNVGDKIDYFEVTENDLEYNDGGHRLYDAEQICFDIAEQKGYHPYYVVPIGDGELEGCRVYEQMNEPKVRQDSRAIGTKIVNGKSVLPLYGITYMEPRWGYESIVNNNVHDVFYDNNGAYIVEGTPFEGYLNGYFAELESQGFEVADVTFVTLNRVIDFLEETSGREVNYNMDFPEINNNTPNIDSFIGKMDIKDYITEGNEWLYSVTYWLGSGYKENDFPVEARDYYISNEGLLCALGRGECAYLPYPIGNGVRPLIQIRSDSVKYTIRTETDGHGTIEVIDSAFGGETINFRVTSGKGYQLKSILVKTDQNEIVEFDAGEMIKNDDGTLSIDRNVFTMPFENVVIQARWEMTPTNPKTGINFLLLAIIIVITLFGAFRIRKNSLQ